MLHNKTNQTLRGLRSLRFHVTRLAITLAIALLTATTAWAFKTETPTSYMISCTNGKFKIYAGTTETESWNAEFQYVSSTRVMYYYWKANVSHKLANGMTINTDVDVVTSSLTTEGIHTASSGDTKFTFKAPSTVAITNVTFKNGSSVVSATNSASGTTYTVTLAANTTFDSFEVTYGYIGGKCGDNANWTLSKQNGQYTKLTISGSGAMNSYEHETVDGLWRTKAPWDWQDLTSVTIGNDITTIGDYAFIGCQKLASLTIGTGVTTIGTNAFDHCDALTEVTLPAGVASIGDQCFKNCVNLQRVNIQRTDGLITLGSNVFQNDNALQYIVAPTPALALQYKTASNWSGYAAKMSAEFGGYVFYATNEGGTAAYAITSEDDLRNLASALNENSVGIAVGKTFRQTGDITLSDTNFTPIGTNSMIYFSGTYDGGGYTINGLHISHLDDINNYGLFGYVKNGIVKNVRLVSLSGNLGYVSSSTYYGALIGSASGTGGFSTTVQNCVVISPNIEGSGSIYKGAIIGQNDNATLQNLYFYEGNLNNAIGKVGGGSSGTNVGRAHKVTLGSGIGSVTPAINPTAISLDNGFVYNDTLYYREGAELTLASNLSATGKHTIYKAGEKTLSGDTYTVSSSDVTLTAELAYNTYTVQFNKNHTDATGTMSNQSFTYGTAQNLSANAFTRTDYTFAGWATSANGSVVYSDKQSVNNLTATNGGTVTLYAKWTPTNYTITYHLNGGTLSTNKNSYTIESPDITLDTPTRTGFIFGGWFTNNGNAVTTIAHGSTGNKDYWAKWLLPYIDADGQQQQVVNPTVLTGSESTDATYLDSGWYVVTGNVSYSGSLICSNGNIYLVLCDGASLTINGAYGNVAINAPYLTIYGQTQGTGTLTASANNDCIFAENNITINGGNVTATSTSMSNDDAICTNNGNITINGGSVEASGNNGINARNGNITLGWTRPDDRITASSISTEGGTVKIADGQTLTDGSGNIYTGTLTGEQLSAIEGKKLEPCYAVTFDAQNGDDPIMLLTTFDENGVAHVAKPNDPIRSGFTFEGWFTAKDGNTEFDFTKAVTENTTAYAHWNENTPVEYIDENGGTKKTQNYILLTNGINVDNLPGGWYVVEGEVKYTSQVTFNGDAHLILADDATIEIKTECKYGIYASNNLTIYGQSGQGGILNDTAKSSFGSGIYGKGTVTIIGGTVEASGTNGYGIYGDKGVTISGGTVTATSTNGSGIYGYNGVTISGGSVEAVGKYGIDGSKGVTISGGTVTATGIGFYGIHSSIGNITLGWTNSTDSIKASSYYGKNGVSIAEGKSFKDENGIVYSGTLTDEQLSAIKGKTLTPVPPTPVQYIDENGNEKSIYEYTVLTAEMAANELPGGWYVLENSDPNYTDLYLTNTLWFNDNVNLILADGADMGVAVKKGDAINVAGKLTVYGQSNQTGTLYAIGSENGINAENGIVVNGGCVKAYGGDYKYGFNGGEKGVDIHLKHYNSYILGSSYREPVTVSGLALHGQDNNGIYEGDLDKAQIENMAYQYQLLEPCYVVKFDKDNNTDPEFLAATFNKEGVAHVAKPEVPTREGYTFLEWVDKPQAEYTSGVIRKRFDFTAPVKQNTYVYAKWWKNDPVQYVAYDPDEDKVVTKTVEDYTVLTPWTDVSKGLPAEWYIVVNSNEDEEDDEAVDLRFTKQLDFNSETTHIILMDDAQMVVGDDMNSAIHANVLNIYGQSIGSGKLVVNSDSWAIEAGSFNIYGGIVHAFGKLVGIYSYNTAHLYGGYVYVANGNYGIYVNKGDLILDWTRKDDGYNINGYAVFDGGSVVVADGKYFTDGEGNYYYGTLTDDETSAIAGKTLSPATQTEYIQAHFSVNGDGTEYTIHTATGWNLFCDALQDNDTWNRFSGKTVKLGADITVTRMAGGQYHDFCGTFDGQGNTLTVSYSGSSYVAPFSYVDGATIQNLVVEGTISSTGTRAAGVIGETGSPGEGGTTTSHIINCVSSSTITGGNFSGGFSIGGNVEIEGCVFNGTINISGDYGGGGFVGYSQSALTITNSLFAPQSGSSAKGTFYYNGTAGTITNSYYTTALGTAQGKKACPAIAAPIGDATHATYSVSQITPYANGLTCGETFYYGGGENVSVSYVNESGYTVSHNCTALDPSYMPTKDLSGWYYVADNITYTDKITLGADVTFILADDKTMNIGTSESPRDGYCITGGTKDLTIYGQTNQSGTLNAYNDNKDAAAVKVSDYTQYGGNVNIDAKKNDALWPYNGNLTLTRGTLTANAASDAIFLHSGYTATVSGGTLTASNSGDLSAIYGALALSGTATVKVTGGISGNVTIAAGQVFTDGNGHYYTGTLSADEKTAIDGQTLTRLTALQLADAGDNSAAIDKCNGIAFPVTLQGRTLYKDGNWNTLCLPFDLTIAGSILDGADVRALDNANLTGGVLTLNFTPATGEGAVTTIEAGKPYIIKWASDENLVNPVFSGVAIKSGLTDFESEDHKVLFKGTYNYNSWDAEDKSILFVGASNNLYWPQSGASLGACRAYFQLTDGASAREFVLNFGEDNGDATRLNDSVKMINDKEADAWYTLDGRKLDSKPTRKGLYIYGGRKVVIK